jgi:hypothetical protein
MVLASRIDVYAPGVTTKSRTPLLRSTLFIGRQGLVFQARTHAVPATFLWLRASPTRSRSAWRIDVNDRSA